MVGVTKVLAVVVVELGKSENWMLEGGKWDDVVGMLLLKRGLEVAALLANMLLIVVVVFVLLANMLLIGLVVAVALLPNMLFVVVVGAKNDAVEAGARTKAD